MPGAGVRFRAMELTTAAERLGLIRRSVPTVEELPDAPHIAPPPRSPLGDSKDNALTLESVYRAVTVLQTFGSQLTLDVWRGNTLIPTPRAISKPNIDISGSAFLAETIGSLATRGNAYWLLDLDPAGTLIAATVLPPLEVAVARRTPRAPRTYSWRGTTYDATRIAHLQLMRDPERTTGLGPIQAWQASATGAVRLRGFADGWMDDAHIPSGILSTETRLTSEDAAAYKQHWKDSVSTGDTAVLGGGLSYQLLGLKPSEIQWLESRQMTSVEVARLFGIPASFMLTGIQGTSLTYSNLTTDTMLLIRGTLMAYLREIEEAFTAILPRGQQARFNLDGVMRADTKGRYDAYAVALAAGFLTVNEVRASEGLDALAPATLAAPDTKALA